MSIIRHALAAAAASISLLFAAGAATAGEAEIVSICSKVGPEGPQAIAIFVKEQRQSGQSADQIDKSLVNVTVALGHSVLERGCNVRQDPISACVRAVTLNLKDQRRRAAVEQIADRIDNGACDERIAASAN